MVTFWQLASRFSLKRYRDGAWETVGDPRGLVSGTKGLYVTQATAR